MHPKQVEAEQRKEQRNKTLANGKKVIQEIPSLCFVDRPTDDCSNGITIAYELTGKRLISFSTALVHPVDRYSKKMGRAVAAINFAEGRWVNTRLPPCYKATPQGVRAYMENLIYSF